MAMDDDQLYLKIKTILVDEFEVDGSKVSMQADLYEELEIDSIDAVDLLVQLKEITGKKIPPEQFKEVRTIGDVLNTLSHL
jgi:acyl carrier protein